jgi:hypothetical protein
MDQPALDQRLGTVGANPPVAPEPQRSWSRTDIAGNAGDKPLQPTLPR